MHLYPFIYPWLILLIFILGVVAYVDIRSPLGGAISALTRNLTTLGAIVMSTRNSSVTHVIFRKGDPDTKYWAEKRGLFIVTPAWVTACSKERVILVSFNPLLIRFVFLKHVITLKRKRMSN